MAIAQIYKPSKSAMQSGRLNTRKWVFEFEPDSPKQIDPLMGWSGSGDVRQQVRLKFETKDEAIAFAERSGLTYRVDEPRSPTVLPKSYASIFLRDIVV